MHAFSNARFTVYFLLVPCAIAASPYSLSSLSLLTTSTLSNVTSSSNISVPSDVRLATTPPNRDLPSDPFTYLIPHPHVPDMKDILIKFYHYGPLLAKVSIYTVLSEALRDVNAHGGDDDKFIGTKERWYDDDGKSAVVLLLHPGREMEWYAWGQALRGLFWFAGQYDGVELFFDVFERDAEGGDLNLQGTGAMAR